MKPVLLHMLGIPGAGKTTFLNILHARWNQNPKPFLLGFDQIMHDIPEYQAMNDKIDAFDKFELPAREAGYKKLGELIDQNASILFDNGGSAASHLDILEDAKSRGYDIILVSIITSVGTAKRHVDTRAVTEGRHTPMNYLEDREAKIRTLYSNYKSLTPHFYELENKGLNFPEFEKSCYKLTDEILTRFKDQ